ncbi:MAG: amidohydrolase family protein, partial [Halapricum sp.]
MLITDATLPDGRTRDVRVEDETVTEIREALPTTEDERSINASGKRLTPGMIDAHVHFRQPGFAHKETWKTGSESAAAGGVTTVVDQPNTDPPTIDGESFDRKVELAADSLVDFGINGGVTEDWLPNILLRRPLFALGEVFLADSTGNMGIEADLFADALKQATERDITVTVHAEDATRFNESAKERDDADAWSAYRAAQAEIDAVRRACTVAEKHDARIHVAHTS